MGGSLPRGWGWSHGNILRAARRAYWGSGWYTHTAHAHTDPSGSITVVNPIHPLYGRTLPIRQVCRVEHLIELIVEHPDGGVLTLPAWATDYAPRPSIPPGASPHLLLHPVQLVRLARPVAAHRAGECSSRPLSLDMATPDQPGMFTLSMTTAVQGEPHDPTAHTPTVAASSPLGRATPADPAHGPARRPHARAQRPHRRHRGAV